MRKYYEAYDQRYRQVHERGLEWFVGAPTPIVAQMAEKYCPDKTAPVLEIGCGEGNDAAHLLDRGYNLLATDVSPEAVDFCRRKYPRWAECFRTLDCLKDQLDGRFAFIYAVAVLHMLVLDEDRQGMLAFIRDHLTEEGAGLIVVMGDGDMQRATDISAAFDLQERIHEHSGQKMLLTFTSCRMVTRTEFRTEIEAAGLVIAEMGDTSWDDMPFAMYAVVKRG